MIRAAQMMDAEPAFVQRALGNQRCEHQWRDPEDGAPPARERGMEMLCADEIDRR
jgi:hypothetical protein